jgi:hypothetical protein
MSPELKLSPRDIEAALVRAHFLGSLYVEIAAPRWAHAGHWLPTRYGRACVVEACDGSLLVRIPVADIERTQHSAAVSARVDAAPTAWRAQP